MVDSLQSNSHKTLQTILNLPTVRHAAICCENGIEEVVTFFLRQGLKLNTEQQKQQGKKNSRKLTGNPERSEYFLAGFRDGGASILLSVQPKRTRK